MSDKKLYKIGLIQIACTGNERDNVKKAVSGVEDAAKNNAKVICLPELFKTRYFCKSENPENFDLAEPIPGANTKKFSKLAKKLKVVIILPIFEKRALGIYHNSLAVIDTNGEIASIYRKMHIPDDPGYYEKYYFTPGDQGFKAVNTSVGKIGTLICWDQWFPEAARIVALNGANIIFYPTAIGWHPSEKEEFGKKQLDAWITVQRGHAIANGVYVASVNRVGFEANDNNDEGIEFWGSSFICGPQGEIIAQASNDKEQTLYAWVDISEIENIRRNWPFLRDRRLDYYSALSSRIVE
ncbi:MAG: acyltransferase [Candidatus Dadabacteria bacterium]|nr:carbon-nitrogen hydrolase [Candidatus Dadabacteria bacterium]NIV41974.1 acyltransferase [Candidatus Dadabacteria bacterium]NIX14690.1 acyltransferase [Candidatus Dadabacteria bacterium]NIY21595.1 acyltransferase [Candidatus Dadabacteria bacterium]